jgi:COMPASS component SWD3
LWFVLFISSALHRQAHSHPPKQAADKIVKIWSPHTGEFIRNLTGHTKGLSDIAWSSDSVFLASASDDTSIRIWTVDTVSTSPRYLSVEFSQSAPSKGLTTKVLRGHTSFVFCVNYNSASNLLVSGGCDGDVRIWDVVTGTYAIMLHRQSI